MAPHQHLAWLDDNITWFEQIPLHSYSLPVPRCPGWSVEDVINHLSLGLGLAYPVAMSKAPSIEAASAFDGTPWPAEHPVGRAAHDSFSTNLRSCLRMFSATEPATPCWTYAGPGTAAFWFRRAAIETALHRLDVEEVVPIPLTMMSSDRTADAIAETVEFALPLASEMSGEPDGRLTVKSPDLDIEHQLGVGPRQAIVTGEGRQLLDALWGRHRDQVSVTGDQEIATAWLSRIQLAFAGR